MKKILITTAGSLCLLMAVAQNKIDRSVQPKAGPAPIISIKNPTIFTLPNGMTILVVENHKFPKVTATLHIDAGPIKQGSKVGALDLLSGLLGEGTTTMPKAAFDAAIDRMGSQVNLSNSGGEVASLTRYFDQTFALFADALRNPAFPPAAFDKLKTRTITALKTQEKNTKAISARMVNALSYGVDHPMGEFQTEATTNAITLDDIKNAYKKYVTPSRSYLTFVGDITPLAAKALAFKTLGTWTGPKLVLPVLPLVSNTSTTEVDLVDVPNAVQSEITVTNLLNLPLSSPDYFAVLLANQILGGGPEARLFTNLREKHGFTYGSYSNAAAGRFQTMFSASASVRNEKTDSAVTEMLHELNRIRTEKVSVEELKNAKSLYNGSFALNMENPAVTARYASNIIINNLPKDFYSTYLQKINAVTVEDIQRVSQKYFNEKDTRVVAVGKAAQIKEGLGKLGYPVKEYDKYAVPVIAQNASANGQAMVGVSSIQPSEIVNNYIKAIGGADELSKVTSINTNAEMSMQGMTMKVTKKEMAPNLSLMEIKMGEQSVMRQVFDGTTGSQSQMGNKKEMDADDIAEKKNNKGLFPQMFYASGGYKLESAGRDKVDGKDAYKITVTLPSGKFSTEYYDVTSSLLVKEESAKKAMGQDVTTTLQYGNYKKVGNIMLPFTKSISVQTAQGGQDFTIESKDAKLNEGVTTADFK